MAFWSKLFEKDDGKSHQLPSSMVVKEFGEVNVCRKGPICEVNFTILMEPTGAGSEGWQTGVAIDASRSMKSAFGRVRVDGLRGKPPSSLLETYRKRGWLTDEKGGEGVFTNDAKEDLVERGHLAWSKNEVEPMARKITAYLASNLDADGGTTVIYWACGDGSQLEVVGDLTADDCAGADFPGPGKVGLGSRTILTPAVEYFAERFRDARNGMYIFVTDGEIADMPRVKEYTIQLCQEIQRKQRNPIKCVLIGVGSVINEAQMEELDDLDSGTNVDIWDHKIASDMRSLVEIFAEVVDEHQVIAPTGRILDSSGNVVKNFADGVPARVDFTMPAAAQFFELEVGGQRIRQSVAVSK